MGEGKLEFHFTDNISVYDKEVPNEIPKKGATLCKTSAYLFQKIENLGIDTHFIETTDDDKIAVKKIELIEDYEEIEETTTDYMIPLEFISRYFVAGSLHDRIQRDEIDYEDLGFSGKPEYGERLPEPYFEVITKLERYDRNLTKEEAMSISGLNEEEYEQIKEMVFEIDEMINETAEKNGLLHVDGKKEFAVDENGDLMIVDTFGTADEDRYWGKKEYENGNFVQKSKEFIRDYYKDINYHEKVMEARRRGEEEPAVPPLPEEKVEKVSELYIDLMTKLTDGTYGEKNG